MIDTQWLGRASIAAAAVTASFMGGTSLADDLGTVRLFEQDYILQRFDYYTQVQFPDMKTAGNTCRLIGVTGATYDVENGVLVVASNMQHQQAPWSYKNYVMELRLTASADGRVTGVRHNRTLLAGDTSTMGYDLDPRGVTINTSTQGLGAGSNVVVATANNWLRAFDRTTGEPLVWYPSEENGFPINTPNTTTEDVAFVPGMSSFYSLWRSPMSACTLFNRFGRTGPAFMVGRGRAPLNLGLPCAITYFECSTDSPRLFDYQPIMLVATDENGPSLEAYHTTSQFVAREALSSRLGPGVTVLPLHNSVYELTLSAVAADSRTGRLFLFNRGGLPGATDMFVLTPIPVPCPADFNLDDFLDFFDYDGFNEAFEHGDPQADFNGDGFLDFFDYDDFRVAFELGC